MKQVTEPTRSTRRKPIPPIVMDLLNYDPATGVLTWKVDRSNGKYRAGSLAGYITPFGYRSVVIGRDHFLAHRVVWFMMTGEQPPECIDHKDCDRANLRWDNLREATHQLNAANRRRLFSNLKGVHLSKWGYIAAIGLNRKKQHIGVFATEEEAHAAYLARAKELFGEFARSA